MESIINQALNKHEKDEKFEREKPRGKTIDDVDEETIEEAPEDEELRNLLETLEVKIRIFGCGGGGCNTLDRLTEEGISGAELIACNTDAKHLLHTHAQKKVLIGKNTTRGLGAGARPEIGEKSARESKEELKKHMEGADIVFITAGMGGGTGTGVAPVVAELAKEEEALVMGVVTLPFEGEGRERMKNAKKGLSKLERYCDTTVIIPNDKLLELVPNLSLNAAFKVADEILMESIKGMTEIITKPGLVNLDYNDVRTIMDDGGVAMIGIGDSDDPNNRVDDAVNQAIGSPLLGEIDLSDANGALIRVTGGPDMTVTEAERAADLVNEKISGDARIIWGCNVEEDLKNTMKILLVITNVHSESDQLAHESMISSGDGIDMVD
ncbi:MAG: cell division protein FtsZ [Thermoplasmatota archaeon]